MRSKSGMNTSITLDNLIPRTTGFYYVVVKFAGNVRDYPMNRDVKKVPEDPLAETIIPVVIHKVPNEMDLIFNLRDSKFYTWDEFMNKHSNSYCSIARNIPVNNIEKYPDKFMIHTTKPSIEEIHDDIYKSIVKTIDSDTINVKESYVDKFYSNSVSRLDLILRTIHIILSGNIDRFTSANKSSIIKLTEEMLDIVIGMIDIESSVKEVTDNMMFEDYMSMHINIAMGLTFTSEHIYSILSSIVCNIAYNVHKLHNEKDRIIVAIIDLIVLLMIILYTMKPVTTEKVG